MRRPSVRGLAAARATGLVIGTALAIGPLAPTASAAITSSFAPARTIELAPGITYQQGIMRTSGGRRQSVRVGWIDPKEPGVALIALLSNDAVVKKELPSHLARRKSDATRTAMLATNGDRSVEGRVDAYAAPHSMLVSGGELMVAQACARPTLGVDPDGGVHLDDVRARVTALEDGLSIPKLIHRVNTHRDDDKVVLFTRRFGPSTRTTSGGLEVILDVDGMLRPSGTQRARVVSIRRGGGDTTLRWGEAVLSVKGTRGQWVRNLRLGQRLTLTSTIVRPVDKPCGGIIRAATGWSDVSEAIGGNWFTARDGLVAAPSVQQYADSGHRDPRTNVGITPDGTVVMVTVDGRQPGYSVGVTLAEMGALMLQLGATDAVNLDGGGSTVMARRRLASGELKVDNRPSDGRERIHSEALTAFRLER